MQLRRTLLLLGTTFVSLSHAISPLQAAKAGTLKWKDAQWQDDGSAQIPLGNGDVTAGVWVSNVTADVRMLIGSSSAFDENTQPVKIGALRLELDPPLDLSHILQTFDPTTASFRIRSADYTVFAYVDANAPVLRVTVKSSTPFGATASLEPYRQYQPSALGFKAHDCHPELRYDHEDTIVDTTKLSDSYSPLNTTVTWYHQNPENASRAYFEETLRRQAMDPTQYPNPFLGRIFGGSLYSSQLKKPNDSDDLLRLEGNNLTKLELQIAVLTERPSTADSWLGTMANFVESATTSPPEDAWQNHKTNWEKLWNRSHITLSSRTHNHTFIDKLNAHLVWDRYLTLIQGQNAKSPIKFNGQAFTYNLTGQGWDYRFWGGGYWWQNTRQPYYNCLMQGDVDVLDTLLDFYHNMLPYARDRTVQQFQHTDHPLPDGAAFFPETTTAFGTYYMGAWDSCDGHPQRPFGVCDSKWIKFHWTGGLELCLMVLDRYEWTRDEVALQKHLELVRSAVLAFTSRYPIPKNGGPVDIFPAQALETWQCHNPANRSDCVTNPTPDIAGLKAVLEKLLALPEDLYPMAMREFWKNYSEALPPLPLGTINDETVIMPGERLPPVTVNSENAELYAVHPYRLFGVGKPNLALAQSTFRHRSFPCNIDWCQDIIDAAMLNMTNDLVEMVEDRVWHGSEPQFRFPGFAARFFDFAPSMDHFATLTIAIQSMLLSTNDDGSFLLFPGLPSDVWNVEFKLHGPNNTVIEASCQNGKLAHLMVDPPEMLRHVRHTGNCQLMTSRLSQVKVK